MPVQEDLQAVEAYLNGQDKPAKMALEHLRKQLMQIEPSFKQGISRGVPFFYYRGKRAVGFRASKTHLSFFIMEGQVLKNNAQQLAGLDAGPTLIRFQPDMPIPHAVICLLVQERLREIDNQQVRTQH